SLSLRSPRNWGLPAGAGSRFEIDGRRKVTLLARPAKLASAVNFMVKPNGKLVTVSSTGHPAYTSVLSNWSSSSALHSLRLGDLILGKVSRLYAFSVYPDRT